LAGVTGALSAADALVSAAAFGDSTAEASDEKTRSGQELSLALEPTPKVLDAVRDVRPKLPIVGFKTETSGVDEEMIRAARETLSRAELAFVVANDASVMGESETRALVVREEEVESYDGDKAGLGARVAEELAGELAESSST